MKTAVPQRHWKPSRPNPRCDVISIATRSASALVGLIAARSGSTFKKLNNVILSCRYITIYLHIAMPTSRTTTKVMKPKLTDLEALGQAAECLRILAHPHRLRMVQMLLQGRYTVGDLADACDIASHMASEHLRLMQRTGLLSNQKAGRTVYYEIAEPHLANIMACIEARFGKGK